MIICGIDYSLSSPAICVHEGDEWHYDNCKFYYFFKSKKETDRISLDRFYGVRYPELWTSDSERYHKISQWAITIMLGMAEGGNGILSKPDKCFVEGYSFGSVGRVFQIAENTGVLKYRIAHQQEIPLQTFAPTEIKKFATGKGNSNKDMMYESFIIDTGVDIYTRCDIIAKSNAVNDIVDAYYIAKLGFMKESDDSNI